jgi:hypothetical protein
LRNIRPGFPCSLRNMRSGVLCNLKYISSGVICSFSNIGPRLLRRIEMKIIFDAK